MKKYRKTITDEALLKHIQKTGNPTVGDLDDVSDELRGFLKFIEKLNRRNLKGERYASLFFKRVSTI